MANSIYDENIYLKSKSILTFFEEESNQRKEKLLYEYQEYKNIIDEYDEFIYEIASLIKFLEYNSSLDISILISYLINNGYLSYNMNFQKKEKEDLLLSRLGLTIIEGSGVCRNYSAIHNDIFKRLNIFDKQLYCYEGSRFGKSKYANHVINLINYEDNYYGIDTYNGNRLYKFKDELDLKEISLSSNNRLKYKPYYELTNGESDMDDINYYLKLFKNCSQKSYIDEYEYDIRKSDINNRIRKDEKVYKEFHSKNKRLIKSINKK